MEENYYFILEGKIPKAVTFSEWVQWNEANAGTKRVAFTELLEGVTISTIFLGLNYSFGSGTPILFETTVFNGEYDEYQERYCTWEEAEAGHQRAIEMIFSVD